jgi:hypothetical protein
VSKKKDNIAKRLRELIAEEASRRQGYDILESLGSKWLTDPILNRARQLSDAVKLRPDEPALAKAFAAFELDPNTPSHWHRLINYLARSHFETKPPGAPVTWTPKRRVQLLKDFRSTSQKFPESDVLAIARQMLKDKSFDGRYDRLAPDSLRRQIYHTIEWANTQLSKMAKG